MARAKTSAKAKDVKDEEVAPVVEADPDAPVTEEVEVEDSEEEEDAPEELSSSQKIAQEMNKAYTGKRVEVKMKSDLTGQELTHPVTRQTVSADSGKSVNVPKDNWTRQQIGAGMLETV